MRYFKNDLTCIIWNNINHIFLQINYSEMLLQNLAQNSTTQKIPIILYVRTGTISQVHYIFRYPPRNVLSVRIFKIFHEERVHFNFKRILSRGYWYHSIVMVFINDIHSLRFTRGILIFFLEMTHLFTVGVCIFLQCKDYHNSVPLRLNCF